MIIAEQQPGQTDIGSNVYEAPAATVTLQLPAMIE